MTFCEALFSISTQITVSLTFHKQARLHRNAVPFLHARVRASHRGRQSQRVNTPLPLGWYADAFVSLYKSRHLKKLKFLPQNVTLISCMGFSSGRMTSDPHLEDDSQIREIWELGTERPEWPCLLMNALGEHVWVCFLACNWTQGHFHYDVCIWRRQCSGLGGFDLSPEWLSVCVFISFL